MLHFLIVLTQCMHAGRYEFRMYGKEETERDGDVFDEADCGYVIKGIILSTFPTWIVDDETDGQTACKNISHYMAISLAKVDGEFVPLYNI